VVGEHAHPVVEVQAAQEGMLSAEGRQVARGVLGEELEGAGAGGGVVFQGLVALLHERGIEGHRGSAFDHAPGGDVDGNVNALPG